MSDRYERSLCAAMIAVALLKNDVDAEGEKVVIPTSCECDADGALTMRILSLLAGEIPSNLIDIKFFEKIKKEFILANCGSMIPYFTKAAFIWRSRWCVAADDCKGRQCKCNDSKIV